MMLHNTCVTLLTQLTRFYHFCFLSKITSSKKMIALGVSISRITKVILSRETL